jgi:SAM-dependent methyltransferase
MIEEIVKQTLLTVAQFYDRRKVGDVGSLGFRRSSDLAKLVACLDWMVERHVLVPQSSSFLDLGCADGRVNVLLSYLVRKSVGIEIDEWTLEEYEPLRKSLDSALSQDQLLLPPENISLYLGDSTDESLHQRIDHETGLGFEDFDLYYTYLTMQEEFAGIIRQKARSGAVFMVYGLGRIVPRLPGFRLLSEKPLEGVLALYEKT